MDCWKNIQSLGKARLRTLGQRKSFEIVEVTDRFVSVKRLQTKTTKTIPREAFEQTCRKIVALGHIELKEIESYCRRCSSYVGAILVKALPDIDYTITKPILLVLKSNPDVDKLLSL